MDDREISDVGLRENADTAAISTDPSDVLVTREGR